MKKNSFHLITFGLFFLGFAVLTALPKLLATVPPRKGTDQASYQKAGAGDVLRITGEGGLIISSPGISSPERGLLIRHEEVTLFPSSQSFYINPEITISTQGFPQASTTYIQASTAPTANYVGSWGGSSMTALTNTVPLNPRTLEILAPNATGFIALVGTDCFNRSTREVLNFASNTITQSRTCWAEIDSMTITYTPQPIGGVMNSTSAFYVGTSSGFAEPFRADFSSDVYRVTWAQPAISTQTNNQLWNPTVISTVTVDTLRQTVQISSQAFPFSGSFGASVNSNTGGYSSSTLRMSIWGVERRTPYSP